MGQYYNILTFKDGKYTSYNRSYVDKTGIEHYMLAKIMEHSWLGNSTMESFSNIIFENPMKIAWIGDYATELEIIPNKITKKKLETLYNQAWKKDGCSMPYRPLNVKYLLLVNWTKNEYIDMYEYIKANSFEDWCIHPLSLLTALGNGLGGGDYHGINQELIGSWAFDEISFESAGIEDDLIKQNFHKKEIEFKEK